ncbi:MAG: hypothetical protein HRT64_05380 [Erythrobacter sp.]|nr:hypothetical protein [Erythrobacter sp.]
MIERADLLIAVWDGQNRTFAGGTGHTVMAALANETPVLLIDPSAPERWSIVTRTEELLGHLESETKASSETSAAKLNAIIESAHGPADAAFQSLEQESWRTRSALGFGFYRRIEQLFGGRTTQSGTMQSTYEAP